MTPLIKYAPEAYLIARPQFDIVEMRRFLHKNDLSGERLRLAKGTDAEKITEMATRLCYQSYKTGRPSDQFHDNIIESGHGSTLEHVSWTIILAGVSRSFTHELVRHRAGFAYSQLSQRYVNAENTAFVMPPMIQELPQIDQDVWIASMVSSLDSYKTLINQLESYFRSREGMKTVPTTMKKRVREAARSALPNATETHIAVTANARAWRHFIEMRSAGYADIEMRRVANAIYWILVEEAPMLFGDFVEEADDGDEPTISQFTTKNHKI